MRNIYSEFHVLFVSTVTVYNLHEIEHALFDVRNSREKYLAVSRYDTHTSFSRELTRTSFSYVCHGLNSGIAPETSR